MKIIVAAIVAVGYCGVLLDAANFCALIFLFLSVVSLFCDSQGVICNKFVEKVQGIYQCVGLKRSVAN